MNYGNAENEIVVRLNTHFATKGIDEFFVAAVMPETEDEANEFEKLFPRARVAVEYTESNYQRPSSLRIVRQEETLRFRLLFESRKLRGEGGLYTMMQEVKLSLIGFRLTDCDELFVVGYGKQQYESGVWLPYLDFETKTLNAQAFQPEELIFGQQLKGVNTTTPPVVLSNEFNSNFQ